MSTVVDSLNGLIKGGKWFDALSYIASLDGETRANLLKLIASQTDVNEYVNALAYNAAIETKRYTDIVDLVKAIKPDVVGKVLGSLAEVAKSEVSSLVSSGDYKGLEARKGELFNLYNMLPADVKEGFKPAYYTILLYTDADLRGFKDAVNNGKWVDAYALLEKIVGGGKEDVLKGYSSSVGVDYGVLKSSVIFNYLSIKIKEAKSIDEVVNVVKGFENVLPGEVREKFKVAELISELGKAKDRKDWEAAASAIEKAPQELRKSLAMYFIHAVKDKLTPDDYDAITKFADRFGINELVEIKFDKSELADLTENIVKESFNSIVTAVIDEIVKALQSKDVRQLNAVYERYKDVLADVKVKDVPIADIVKAVPKFIELQKEIEIISSVVPQLQDKLNTFFSSTQSSGSIPRFDFGLEDMDRALEAIDRAEKYRDAVKPLDGTMIEGLGDFFNYLNDYRALLHLGKAMYFYTRQDKRAIDSIAKAAQLNKGYSELALIIKLSLEPTLDEIDCILGKFGLTYRKVGGAPTVGGGASARQVMM